MPSRRERSRRSYQQSRSKPSRTPVRTQRSTVQARSSGTGSVRTVSPRTWKMILIGAAVLLLLLLLTPKPPQPPQDGQSANSQSQLQPMELKDIKTTIPPVTNSDGGELGKTLKDKLKVNQ